MHRQQSRCTGVKWRHREQRRQPEVHVTCCPQYTSGLVDDVTGTWSATPPTACRTSAQ